MLIRKYKKYSVDNENIAGWREDSMVKRALDAHGTYSGSFLVLIWKVTSVCNTSSRGLNACLPIQAPGTHVKDKQNIHNIKVILKI